ncbi:MAG: Protein MraZ [Parcubacteria group bacterium GW2011_GWB1_41_6]|nr:MAG: Protein MraZ [Parcubacteria group bacterium GW2011_GWB1_41_6]KKS33893.1 MAG: Protein MraZ [Parcubacteria group bacterium GW2011_GWC2_42_13]KKS58116.1 MAG: Protein MraZ [Parcubacteria group bacterium GW2011_GWA2_42_35]
MLIGEYKHTIDAKKRISLPAKFRRELGKKAVITRGLDKCLFVYSLEEWKKVAETLSGLSTGQADSRNFGRLLLAGAVDVEIDSLGRILIPDYLKNYAELKDKAIVAGVYKRIEIWDEKRWEEFKSGVEEKADLLAEKLGELGLY